MALPARRCEVRWVLVSRYRGRGRVTGRRDLGLDSRSGWVRRRSSDKTGGRDRTDDLAVAGRWRWVGWFRRGRRMALSLDKSTKLRVRVISCGARRSLFDRFAALPARRCLIRRVLVSRFRGRGRLTGRGAWDADYDSASSSAASPDLAVSLPG